jgi:hypothetical protein
VRAGRRGVTPQEIVDLVQSTMILILFVMVLRR